MTLGMHCLGSLANNMLCGIDYRGEGEFTAEGINTLCDALKSTTTLTSLKYASQLESLPTNVLTAFDVCLLCVLQRRWHSAADRRAQGHQAD